MGNVSEPGLAREWVVVMVEDLAPQLATVLEHGWVRESEQYSALVLELAKAPGLVGTRGEDLESGSGEERELELVGG